MSLVKWVMPERTIASDEGFTVKELKEAGRVPVVELADLTELVETLKLADLVIRNGAPKDDPATMTAIAWIGHVLPQLEAYREEGA